MFSHISKLFQTNKKILKLLSYREEIIASNIANADTPNYKSKKINFRCILKKIFKNQKNILNTTSKNHLQIVDNLKHNSYNVTNSKINTINNNTVDMNDERTNFLDNSLRYHAEITFLNSQIKNLFFIIKN